MAKNVISFFEDERHVGTVGTDYLPLPGDRVHLYVGGKIVTYAVLRRTFDYTPNQIATEKAWRELTDGRKKRPDHTKFHVDVKRD